MKPALSASRAVAIFDLLTAHPKRSFTQSELGRLLDVSPASMSAVLLALTQSGYLARHPRHRTYQFGPAIVTAGRAAGMLYPAVDLARHDMRRLAAHGSECVASVVAGGDMLILAIEGAPTAHSRERWLGQRIPLLPPMGQIFMAWAGAAEVGAWMASIGGPDRDALGRHLASSMQNVRRRGYSLSLLTPEHAVFNEAVERAADQPSDAALRARIVTMVLSQVDGYALLDTALDQRYDVATLAVPVFGVDGEVALALTLYELIGISGAEIEQVAGEMLAVARAVTRAIGGRTPEAHLTRGDSHDGS